MKQNTNDNERQQAEFQRLTQGKHGNCYLEKYCKALDSQLPKSSWCFFSCEGDVDVLIMGDGSVGDLMSLIEIAAKSLAVDDSLEFISDEYMR